MTAKKNAVRPGESDGASNQKHTDFTSEPSEYVTIQSIEQLNEYACAIASERIERILNVTLRNSDYPHWLMDLRNRYPGLDWLIVCQREELLAKSKPDWMRSYWKARNWILPEGEAND